MHRSQSGRGVAAQAILTRSIVRIAVGVSGLLAISTMASADETVAAGLPAGGLSATLNAGVALAAERVLIARESVHATYVFRNSETVPVTTLLAFRAPRLTAFTADASDSLPGDDPLNFMALGVTVEGEPLRPSAAQRASILGLDLTERLKADNVPLNPYLRSAGHEALAKLGRDKRSFYKERGLAQWTTDGEPISVQWDVDTTLHWMQTFPPDKPLKIEVRYMPASGTAILTSDDLAAPGRLDGLARAFCLTADAKAKIAAGLKRDTLARPSDEGPALLLTRVDYDLGADAWAGFVPDFELVVRKPEKGGSVGFCAPGQTIVDRGDALAVSTKDFAPRGMISVLYAGAAASQ